jgi:hypothetical protein
MTPSGTLRPQQFGPGYLFAFTAVVAAAAAALCAYERGDPMQRQKDATALIGVALASPFAFAVVYRRVLQCPVRAWFTWTPFPLSLAVIGFWHVVSDGMFPATGILLLGAAFFALFAPIAVVGVCSAIDSRWRQRKT